MILRFTQFWTMFVMVLIYKLVDELQNWAVQWQLDISYQKCNDYQR